MTNLFRGGHFLYPADGMLCDCGQPATVAYEAHFRQPMMSLGISQYWCDDCRKRILGEIEIKTIKQTAPHSFMRVPNDRYRKPKDPTT